MNTKKTISTFLLKGFGKLCGPGDQKRLAGQTYPTLVEYDNIPYIDDGDPMHLLDIYVPNGTPSNAKLPVIVDYHGGGWSYGDKDLNKNYCLHLAERGFLVVDASYRLAPTYKIDDQMRDCMAVLAWMKDNLSAYPCDMDRIYLTGDSAGGQLASHIAAANLSDDICKSYGMERVGLSVKAVCLTSPALYLNGDGVFSYYLDAARPDDYGTNPCTKYFDFNECLAAVDAYPPTIIFTSLMDVITNWQCVKATKALQEKGVDVQLDFQMNPKLMHVYPVLDPDENYGRRAGELTAAWFNNHQ